MTQINRRTLLAGTAATGAFAATSALALDDHVEAKLDLTGTSILITGCSSGFGRLGAEHYARLGATVIATMRNMPRPEADDLFALAQEDNLDLHVLEMDVLDDGQVERAVVAAQDIAGGALDVVINNAAISTAGPIEIQDMQATQLMFDTNVFGPQRVMRAALPAMRAAKSGFIINISSQLGRVIVPGYGQYSPTKFALEAMSEATAYEVASHGIDVNVIQPGGYPTMIWKNANENTLALLARADDKHLSGYPAMIEQLGQRTGGGSTDPMDVPRAIAKLIAMPGGTRPLRTAVHPGLKPQMAINEVSAQAQVGWLGASPYGPMIKAVHNVGA